MSRSSTTETHDRVCLHCSPARTVWQRRGVDGTDVVEKVYVTGSPAEAEHEVAMGIAAAGEGVARYLSADSDADTGRPTVTIEHAPGDNLEAIVASRGALPAVEAITRVLPVARALARLHGLRSKAFPRGICHGDVKPQNLLATEDGGALLLDFEHATAIGAPSGVEGAFTGGTSAWSPPEAHTGAAPVAAFDVFGLGATLAFLLDGDTSRHLPRHPAVDALVRDCCNEDPAQRPSAAEVAERCERLVPTLRDDEREQNLDDWATGELRHEPTDDSDPRAVLWWQRRRLLDRLPDLLRPPATQASAAAGPEVLLLELEQCRRALARFPRSVAALRRRADLLAAAADVLGSAAEHVHDLTRAEQFEQAELWLRTTDQLAAAALALPGGLGALTRPEPGVEPTARHRAPIEFLAMLTTRAEAARDELAARVAEVSEAEAALDLNTAQRKIDAMAADYGGTSPTTADRRDQLHRLTFYLDRVARAQSNVERVGPMWDPVALQPLQAVVAAARKALDRRAGRDPVGGGSGAVGLRSLQLTLSNLAVEFPHLERVPPALEALSQALVHLTDQAWQQLDDAELRLTVVPVPVRPLQLALGRLDTFRMLEAFVDRPERPRSELLDGLERLRLGLEQARSARDRLAENAEDALARGHWTTGLFDMERAVAGLNPGDDTERAEAERLSERLQAARRTKQELEAAVRRNVELSATYTELEDDPSSTYEARLQALHERRDCLLFLAMHVPSERAELYRSDLRAVETSIAVERAGDADRRLALLTDPSARLRLARDTVDALAGPDAESSDPALEKAGRTVRLLEYWRSVASQCQRTVDDLQAERDRQQKRRRRVLAIAVLTLVVTTVAVGFALEPWLFGEPAMAGEKGDGR